MTTDNNRLLLELEKFRREINREVINPQIPTLSLADLKPVLTLVANVRAKYVRTLFEVTERTQGETPSEADMDELKRCREEFDTLVSAVNALETVIQRDYLDVSPSRTR